MASLRKRIYKPGKTSWVIDYYKGKKYLMKTIGSCNKRTAEKIFHKFVNDQNKSKVGIVEVKKVLLSDLHKEYLQYSESIRALKTVSRERQIFNSFLRHFGDVHISEIGVSEL